jgi:protein pelota
MKSNFNLKNGIGKITPENPDDLWVLESILKEGDLIRAKTPRSQDIVRDGKKDRGPKRLVLLTLKLEKKELDDVLKLRGKIVDGPDDVDRGYHTIEADAGTFMTIKREWKSWEVDKIKKAADKTEPVLVLILDEREADLYRVRGKVEHLVHIDGKNIGKGGDVSGRKGYFGEIISVLEGKDEKIVVAGPGFSREDLVKEIKERKSNVGKIIIEGCSHTGMNGMEEVLKRKVLDRVIKNSRLEEEVEEVEKFFEAIAKDGKITYGKNEVIKAVESGAVEKLLIIEKLVRENEKLLEGVEKIGGKIMIISEESQSGKKFSGISGIGAFLRYRME